MPFISPTVIFQTIAVCSAKRCVLVGLTAVVSILRLIPAKSITAKFLKEKAVIIWCNADSHGFTERIDTLRYGAL